MSETKRRKLRAWDYLESKKAKVSWREKSWVSRRGIPELVNYPADNTGKPEPSFETALEAVEAEIRRIEL